MLHLAAQGLLPVAAAVPAAARRHHVEVPGDVRVPRPDGRPSSGMDLLVHQNPECVELGINPFDHGSAMHTDMWKTEGLKQALDQYGFDLRLRRRPPRRGEVAGQGAGVLDPLGAAPVGPEAAAARAVARSTTRARSPGETHAGVPAVELDRARRVAVHPPRADPDRAAVLRGAAAGRRARRHADHGRRRPHAARARRGARAAQRPVPHPRLLPAHRRDRERGRHADRDHPGDAAHHHAPSARVGSSTTTPAGSMEKKKQEGYF